MMEEAMSAVREVQITFDCADPRALSHFWNSAIGYVFPPPPAGFESWDAFSETLPFEQRNMASASQDPTGSGPRLFFQQVPEGKTAKNRLHLDVRAAPGLRGDERMAALEAECDRLLALGASRLQRFEPDPPMSYGFIVMQDPEGNEFCLD
jgi:hypothetical protein